MKLFKVEFPTVLVGHVDKDNLEDYIIDQLGDSVFYNDIIQYECTEIKDKLQLGDFEDGYIPYGITPDNMTATEVLKAVQIIQALKDSEIEILKQLLKIE